MKIKLFIILLVLLLPGCAGWTINGIPAERIRDIQPRECVVVAAGFAASAAMHWMGHAAYLEANNIDWHQDGRREVITQPISNSQRQWVGRSGFLAQLVGGLALRYSPWKHTWFTTGYHTYTLASIATYPVVNGWGIGDGDLDMINRGGGNAEVEWAIYTTAATLLLSPAPPKKETQQ